MPTAIREKDAVIFRLQKWRMVVLALLGLVLVAQLPLVTAAAIDVEDGTVLFRIVAITVAVAICGVGAWAILFAILRLRGGETAIAIMPAGLFDSVLFPAPVPWKEVKRPSLRYSGVSGWRLMFDVDEAAEERLGIGAWQRGMARFWRSVGARSYRVYLFGTDATMARLRTALEPYITVERPGPFTRILGRE